MRVKGRELPWSTLNDLVRDKARAYGSKVFCEIDGHSLTFEELDRSSDRVAANLAARGVARGDRVASVLFNCVEQVQGWFGCAKLGAVWTPLNAGLRGEDLVHALNESGAEHVVTEPETWERLSPIAGRLERAAQLYSTDADAPGHTPFAALLEPAAAAEPEEIGPGDPLMIIFSGGTTGLPKGVVLPHFAVVGSGYRYGEVMGAGPQDRHYSTLPLFHVGGTQLGIVGPLVNDMTTVMDRRFTASGYWRRVTAVGATIIDPISTMMTVLCEQQTVPDERNHWVRASFGVTGQIPKSVPARFSERFGIPVVDIYGLTEAGGAMLTSNRPGSQVPGSLGRPHGWSEVGIVDEQDQLLEAGEQGEIVMRPTVPFTFMLGYHNNDRLTAQVTRNLWLHTGDVGHLDADGNLFFHGRQVHWLRRRGENISAYEVESVLSQHPGVQEVVVVGVPAELGEEEVKACIIARAEAPDPADLVTWCRERLAAFKVPRFIEVFDDFPRSNTKREVERAKLRDAGVAGAWDREKAMGRLSAQAAAKGS